MALARDARLPARRAPRPIDDERHVAWCRYGGGESYQDVWHELFARCLDCGRRERLGRVVVWGTNRRAPHPWLPDDA
jgi:hypothetical protein